MKKHQLARILRQRQHQLGLLETHVIDAISDNELIDSYITCSDCGEKQVTPAELATAIDFASTVEQFLDLCESFAHARASAPATMLIPRRARTRREGRRKLD